MDAGHDKGSYRTERMEDRDFSRGQRRQERQERKRARWEHHVERRIRNCQNMQHSRKGWLGVGIILVGAIWLASVMGAPIPAWLFSWPMLFVALGLFSGLASGFRNMGSVILIFIGLVFIARNYFLPNLPLDRYVWPLILIFVGILFLVKRHHWEERSQWGRQWFEEHQHKLREMARERRGWATGRPYDHEAKVQPASSTEEAGGASVEAQPEDGEQWKQAVDWIDVTTIFGGAKRHVISKNFKGGDVTNLCGATVIDLTHADIHGTVVIDLVAIWGGIKLAVPPNWQVRLNVTHLMAGTDDRRMNKAAITDPNKVLVITGTVLMAGVEISDHI